jgi:uncharacterized membrane protein YhaH (DUF805 family)
MTMKWTELLFSFRGRIRRLYFWLTTLVFGFAAGMLTSTFQFIAETYGMGETFPTLISSSRQGHYRSPSSR